MNKDQTTSLEFINSYLESMLAQSYLISHDIKVVDNDELTLYLTDMLVAANNAKQLIENIKDNLTV